MKTYIMVWIEEEEKWYYFKESFNTKQFTENGYVDYYIYVENDMIIDDDYNINNNGKKFEECYDSELWK